MEIRRERKVVTVLFVDGVGFTSRSEMMDPEDVEVELTRYHSRVRAELERYGGTVEKFIGDAVMAVFGAPVTHEDDAERAVRAALAVRDWATSDGGLDVRIGVNTGEALIRLGARADAGEGIAVGDVVNTAARLQTAAPVNGVIVGESTYRATRMVIGYLQAESVVAKGKAQPVATWVASEPRSRVGVDVVERPLTRFVGREHELGLLRASLARARAESEPQLVTIVGVPGIGKSRLLQELSRLVDSDPDVVVWRQGRCLPYGAGVNMWALSEILKAEAGILENDRPDVAEAKLAKALEARAAVPDVEWMLTRLRPLVGLRAGEASRATREEQFAAWRQFLEGLAENDPAVVVFEDLHWADDNLLDFIDELIDFAHEIPLFVVCTARPELLAKRPTWGAGRTNALTLSLQPLPAEETTMLLAEMLDTADPMPELRKVILERAGGNPLYAEEFARMVTENPGAELRVPDTVHGIIAARIDTLEADQKRLLQLAAVVGKVFWASAVANLAGGTPHNVDERLRAPERRELIRRERRSSLAGDTQCVFRHIVTRDVAYGQIPRTDRSELHRQVAEWLKALSRPDDHAELIAHHYLAAIDYASTSGSDYVELIEAARRALRHAGQRAVSLGGHGSAADFFGRALELTPEGVERAELLAAFGTARWMAMGVIPAELAEAITRFEELGLTQQAADTALSLSQAEMIHGNHDAAERWLTTADRLLEGTPDSILGYRARLTRAALMLISGRYTLALELVTPVLQDIERLGRPDLLARALDIRGCSRSSLGDESGLEDQRRAVEIARSGHAIWELQVALNNLTSSLVGLGRLREIPRWLAIRQETFDTFGGSAGTRAFFLLWLVSNAYFHGDWDSALRNIDKLLEVSPSGSTSVVEAVALTTRARILVVRDLGYDPRPDLHRALATARSTNDGKTIFDALSNAAGLLAKVGAVDEARLLWGEAMDQVADYPESAADDELVNFAWAAVDLGTEDAAVAAVDRMMPNVWTEVSHAILRHDFARAAEQLHDMGHLPAGALADLHAGTPNLLRALEFYRSVGAARYITALEAAT